MMLSSLKILDIKASVTASAMLDSRALSDKIAYLMVALSWSSVASEGSGPACWGSSPSLFWVDDQSFLGPLVSLISSQNDT